MHGHRISALGLVTLVVGVHAGCDVPRCSPDEHGPYDNRDRTMFPSLDQDWICISDRQPPVPPEPPPLGQLMNYFPDKNGPKGMLAVANAAIFVESCVHDALTPEFNINSRIEAIYNSAMASAFEREVARRLGCLSSVDSGYGCDRVTQCIGVAVLPDEPKFAEQCFGSKAMRRRTLASGEIVNDWFLCNGAGLQCYPTPHPWCGESTSSCAMAPAPAWCNDNVPINCEYIPEEENSYGYYHERPCAVVGETCIVENGRAFCQSTGTACIPAFPPKGDVRYDLRSGIECVDTQTLRACVSGVERLIDCAALGQGFSCLGGSRPHCGADFQCNYDGSDAPPTCEGTLIHVCNAGVPMTFDCAKFGFETCDPERGVCKPFRVDAAP